MKSTIIGPYPRVDSQLADCLRREQNNVYRGSGNTQLVKKLMQDLTREVVREMVSTGIDLPHYGFIDVHDELTWPLEYVNGVEFVGMKKVFHTNTHYRVALVNGSIKSRKPIINDLYGVASEIHPEVKLEFPGWYTMAKHSVLSGKSPYKNFVDLAEAYVKLFREELLKCGQNVLLVQFNEPSLIAYGREHNDLEMVPELYKRLLVDLNVPTAVWTYYGVYSPEVLDILFSLPVDIVGLDFVWDPGVERLLKERSPDKGIGFGFIDSGDRGFIVQEDSHTIIKKLKGLEGYVDLERSFLSPNASLEHLPRHLVRQKIALIGEITRRIRE